MKKFLFVGLLLCIGVMPVVAFGNIEFTKNDATVLAESFKEEFGNKADVAVNTFKRVYDKDKGIDADGMATVYASGIDSNKMDGFSLKKFWSGIVSKVSKVFTDCIWVESDQVCIPANPCENEEYAKYCNRDFKNFHGLFLQNYQFLVDSYAKSHKLSCSFKNVDSVNSETKRALCYGDDVMFFEFSVADQDKCYYDDAIQAWCIASGGELSRSKDRCNSKACDSAIKTIVKQHNSSSECRGKKTIDLKYNQKNESCTLKLDDGSLEEAIYYGWL